MQSREWHLGHPVALYCSLPPTFQLVGRFHAAMTVWGKQCRPSRQLSLRLISDVVSPTLKQFARLQLVQDVAALSSAKLKLGSAGLFSDSRERHRKKATAGAFATLSRLLSCSGSAFRSRYDSQGALHAVMNFVAVSISLAQGRLQLGACPATVRRETPSDPSKTIVEVASTLS